MDPWTVQGIWIHHILEWQCMEFVFSGLHHSEWYSILYISIGNSMVSNFRVQFGKKHTRVSFSKMIKIARVRRTSAIWSLLKNHECMFFQIAREMIIKLIRWSNWLSISICNTKWLKNGKLRKAILFAFYNISQRNFGILLILWCSFKLWWNFCPGLSRSKFHS
jgi:hypothetical protein